VSASTIGYTFLDVFVAFEDMVNPLLKSCCAGEYSKISSWSRSPRILKELCKILKYSISSCQMKTWPLW